MATLQDLVDRDKDVEFHLLEDIDRENITTVEGRQIPGAENIIMHTLFATNSALILHSVRKKGYTDPKHQHDDHETISFLASGRMRVHIGDRTYEAHTGAAWFHGKGVPHWSEALEDSVVLEIKNPPVKTW